jgi:ribosomal protein S16
MVDVYNTEAERRAAIQEVTALRRQFDTTTAKGAKAFAKDPAAQAALKRLDDAKSAAGMRTSAQDLKALNKIATRDVSTADMTPAQRKQERQGLNQPSREYFKQVQQAYKDPTKVPSWKPSRTITPDILAQFDEAGWDASKSRYDWVLIEDNKKQPRWAMGVIGALRKPPTEIKNPADAMQYWMSDGATVGEVVRNIIPQVSGGKPWNSTVQNVDFNELAEAIPEIKYSQFQEIMYQLSLERDEDITIEDILDKYDEMFGKG